MPESKSPFPPPLSVSAALDLLLAAAQPLADIETVATQDACGRVLAADQVSQINVPAADNTQMDGYAVRSADCISGGARLRVSQRIPAGHVGQPLEPGSVARIFTGALIPAGADAVVMQEMTGIDGDSVAIKHVPQPGEWIRRVGEDIRAGAVVLIAGTRLRPQEMGLAASVGLASLPVRRRLRVALFFTGDELRLPGQPLKPGAIYNSSSFTLRGLLQNLGCEISDFGIVPDSLAATRETLRRCAVAHDLIVTAGGVSVGDEDHIKPAVEAEGRLDMWRIAMKPGKPLAFGQVRRGAGAAADASATAPVLGPVSASVSASVSAAAPAPESALFVGLPGNPVSSLVTFLLFVRPLILRLQGVTNVMPRRYPMRADFDWVKADRRNEFLRARVNPDGGLDLFANQGSGVLTSTVWSDGLIDNPPERRIAAGDMVNFIPFHDLLY